MSKLTAKQQHWTEQLAQADAFDGSLAQFAKQQNIPAKTLYRWRAYLRKTAAVELKATFTQVLSTPQSDCSLQLKVGNAHLEFKRLPDPQWLSVVIASGTAS